MHKQIHSPLPLKLIKNRKLRAIVAKATEKTRAKRYQSAAEFRVALEQADLNASSFEWRPAYSYAVGALVACAVGVAVVPRFIVPDPKPVDVVEVPAQAEAHADTYASVVADLRGGHAPKAAADRLARLSDGGDAMATYLLSQLVFRSKSDTDYTPDSIRSMRNTMGLGVDYERAHGLLLKAVDQNPHCYYALYELACDYWKADQRTTAVKERDKEKAKAYFLRAREWAEKAGDKQYVGMIDNYLAHIKQLEENMRLIQQNR